MRSKKDIFDFGKKMTMDKGEKSGYVLCENLSLLKRRKKKNSRNEHERL